MNNSEIRKSYVVASNLIVSIHSDISSEMFLMTVSHLKECFPVIIVKLEGRRVLPSQIADIFPALTIIKRTFKCHIQRCGKGFIGVHLTDDVFNIVMPT